MNKKQAGIGCLIFIVILIAVLYGCFLYVRPKVEAVVLKARMEDQGNQLSVYYEKATPEEKERFHREGLGSLMATTTKELDLRIPFQPWKENTGPGDVELYCETQVKGKVLIVHKEGRGFEWIEPSKLQAALNTPPPAEEADKP